MSEEQIINQDPSENLAQEAQAQLPSFLSQIPGAPSKDQIDAWKKEFGEVFVSGFSETELFVWKPLFRKDFIQIQIAISQLPEDTKQFAQFKQEELICSTCVLWPKTDWSTSKAGTPQSLAEQITQNSNFLAPVAALTLVAKL